MTSNQSNQPPKQPLTDLDAASNVTPNTIVLEASADTTEQELRQIKRQAEQNAQARLLLIQLQWLVIVLMIGAMIWQSYAQKQLAEHIDSRLQQTEKFTTRMNDMDDRLFAMTPSKEQAVDTLQAKNDAELVNLLINTAQTLYNKGDYTGAMRLLQSVSYKLDNKQYQLAAPISASLKQSLAEDITSLQTAKTGTDAWQLHINKIRDIQKFLGNKLDEETAPTKKDLALHDANMMLSLAMHAAITRERDASILYLRQAQNRLNAFAKNEKANTTNPSAPKTNGADEAINSFDQVIFAINEMLADMPKTPTLKSIQLLNGTTSH